MPGRLSRLSTLNTTRTSRAPQPRLKPRGLPPALAPHGVYVANNPALYALADATGPLGFAPTDCRVLSIGCGQYPEPRRGFIVRQVRRFLPVQLLQKTLEVNTASMDQLRQLLFANVPTVRVSDTFDKPEMATDLFEHDLKKLNLLRQQGEQSFGRREQEIQALLLS